MSEKKIKGGRRRPPVHEGKVPAAPPHNDESGSKDDRRGVMQLGYELIRAITAATIARAIVKVLSETIFRDGQNPGA